MNQDNLLTDLKAFLTQMLYDTESSDAHWAISVIDRWLDSYRDEHPMPAKPPRGPDHFIHKTGNGVRP